MESYDALNKSGRYTFGGAENTFNPSTGTSVGGRCGWVLNVYTSTPDGKKKFDLYKKGKFIKNLDTR